MLKRTIAEWVTVSKISKDTGHLFFEGSSDASILAHLFGYPQNIDFRTASEIDDDDLGSSSLWGGYKFRLINLARAADGFGNLRCLIDADFSVFIEYMEQFSNLMTTGCSNLPATTFNYEWLKGFLAKAYGLILDMDGWSFICSVLRFAFVARYVAARIEHTVSAPDLSNFISSRKGYKFDKSAYITRYFPGSQPSRATRCAEIQEICDWVSIDITYTCNSNDIFAIIYSILRGTSKISGSTPRDAIKQAYFGAIDDKLLRQGNLKLVGDWIASMG